MTLAVLLVALAQGPAPPAPSIVPAPATLTRRAGALTFAAITAVTVPDTGHAELRALARMLADELSAPAARTVPVRAADALAGGTVTIALMLDTALALDPEGYRLTVGPEGARLVAPSPAGLFYGIQTVRQLLPPGEPGAALPALEIEDWPRFRYRGMHLDVGRHLFPVAFIKKYIDLMAMYKMNTFHWHLTEDQGWRIEIRKYPRLTTVGAWRQETIREKNFSPYVGDGTPYGGFYTQAQVREIVTYARARYITIVPEIEMPGHSKAALAAYPELACTPGPFRVATVWGVHEDIYCPSDATFAFLEDVLTEVMDLFPGQYIHIGGDEAPKTRWERSPVAQAVIRREGLANAHELQSWFIRRIERFLTAHGRRLIGWDEILEGGLAPDATVMSWRGMVGGIAAARQGHDVIMTPSSHVYFDHYQGSPAFEPLAIGGYAPLEKVYAFEPMPAELTPEEARHVLGAQGNVWTEYIATPEHVEYMAVPRMLALAEVVWSPRERREWSGFVARLPAQLRRLDALDVRYRIPGVRGLEADRLTLADSITIRLESLLPEAQIVYTLAGADGSPARTQIYDGPVRVSVRPGPVRVTARVVLPGDRTSPARSATFAHTTLRRAEPVDADALAPGLRVAYYEGRMSRAARLVTLRPARRAIAPGVALPGDARQEQFGLRFTGYLLAPEDGIYEFALTSDDGSLLRIAGHTVIDHDGFHSSADKPGVIALAAGAHGFELLYFQAGGDRELRLQTRRDGEPLRDLPAEWLAHAR
ncbi:MAG: family 20 glycosylhydrolase [Gemmatimonadota bacterium]|nr:family 20 glycosylhydrolase [Gemmatimonadota bacterium]